MAVNSVNTTSTGGLLGGQRRGLSGLASGMDTDEIIKGMTIGTRTKIAKQKQAKQLLSWQGDAMRNISDKLSALSKKYTSFTSSSNLLSRRFFEQTDIKTTGANASKVEVSGVGSDMVSITRVRQLSVDASVSTGSVSGNNIKTGEINLTDQIDVSNLENKTISIKYGGETHDIVLSKGKDYSTPEKIVESLNELTKDYRVGSNSKLSDKVKFELDTQGGTNKIKMSYTESNDGNNVEIVGGSEDALKSLGLAKGDKLSGSNKSLVGSEMKDFTTKKVAADLIGGSAITFNLNGILKTIKLPTSGELKEPSFTVEKLAQHIQSSLDSVYGAGRIKVGKSNDGTNKLEFFTTDPNKPSGSGFEKDKTSVLKIADADSGVLNVLGLQKGASNRINLDASIKDAGFAGLDLNNAEVDTDGNIKLQINGVDIEGITEKTTVKDLIEKINNNEKAGVKVSYLEMADKFVITSKVTGANGKVEMNDDLASGKKNLAGMLFGENSTRTVTAGKDAQLSIKYKGTDEEIEITRSSNDFTLEGMNIKLKGTFGYTSGGVIDNNAEAVGFSASADSKKIIDSVKGLVEEYNQAIELINKELTTKKDRNYAPLTDEQRKELSEKEIENWEKKAKEGLLFNNPELRALSSEMRFLFGNGAKELGITVSNKYSDNGKIVLDEEKLKTAIQNNADKVRDFFSKSADSDTPGVMHKMKSVLDKYVKTDGVNKGILINRAGSSHSPLSLTNNALSKQMSSIDKVIAQLEGKLRTEETRYQKQFTNLEKLISKMNAQSGYLMQQFGQ